MAKKKIKIKIISKQYNIADELIRGWFSSAGGEELFSENDDEYDDEENDDDIEYDYYEDIDDSINAKDEFDSNNHIGKSSPLDEGNDAIELFTEGFLETKKNNDGSLRVIISYEESEITGMLGATTSITFDDNRRELVSMLRGGSVYTALVFEPDKRNICAYSAENMVFELGVYTRKVKNEIDLNTLSGSIFVDYIIEIRGAMAERNKFLLKISI